jgi:hypothetical protein
MLTLHLMHRLRPPSAMQIAPPLNLSPTHTTSMLIRIRRRAITRIRHIRIVPSLVSKEEEDEGANEGEEDGSTADGDACYAAGT